MRQLSITLGFLTLCAWIAPATAADTFKPYAVDEVPGNAVDLWKDYDPRAEPLDVQIVKQWEIDGVICRYVIFTVGTFKDTPARLAAYYTFPKGAKRRPAFVWCHGGGQRADKTRGLYFAKQGYAVVDINWLGRPMEDDIEANTDWGKIDASQGPRFYPKALRKNFKSDIAPDEHTVDPVPSPRNSNWYLLSLAGRRAITFLEKQPEVDPRRIGFTGFSMGGKVTALVSTDPRLKAVAPMVGGAGFVNEDFPGLPGTGRIRERNNPELYANTIDGRAYWPHARCPVLFVNSSNDFHMPFENIYKSAALLPHDNWRATQGLHSNHSPGRMQWVMLNRWFGRHVKGEIVNIPKTATAKMAVNGSSAAFTVTPDQADQARAVNIYYSHDANARSRFWVSAPAKRNGDTWEATLPVREHLPLFAFADVVYPIGETVESLYGPTDAYSLTSNECVHLPTKIESSLLNKGAKHVAVFDDMKRGWIDWSRARDGGSNTFKFRDPAVDFTHGRALAIDIDVPHENISLRLRFSKNQYVTGAKGPKLMYHFTKQLKEAGPQRVVVRPEDFKIKDGPPLKDWTNIYIFTLTTYDGNAKGALDLHGEHRGFVKRLEWLAPE